MATREEALAALDELGEYVSTSEYEEVDRLIVLERTITSYINEH